MNPDPHASPSTAAPPSLSRLFLIVPCIFVTAYLMRVFSFGSGSSPTGEALLGAVFLSALLLPLLYLLIYRPLRRSQHANARINRALCLTAVRYHHLASGTGALFTEVDTEGILRYANQQTRTIWGLEPDAVIGRSAMDFIHPEDRESTRRAFAGWLASKTDIHSYENRQQHNDGSVRHLLWSIHINRRTSGEVDSLSSIALDITDQKLAKEALRVLALDFDTLAGQSLFEAACRHLAIVLDVDSVLVVKLTDQSASAVVVDGYSHGRRITPFSHRLNAGLCPKMLDKQFCVFPEDQCRNFPSGPLLNQLGISGFLATPLRNRAGRSIGFLVILDSKPLTRRQETLEVLQTFTNRLAVELEQIQISNQLKLSRTLYHDLFSSILDPIIVADQQRIIVDVNQPATRNLFGYETADLVGRSTRVLYADDASFERTGELVFNRPQATGQVVTGQLVTGLNYRRKDGTTFPAETHALKLISEQNQPIGNFAVVRDVSEQQRSEADKRQLEQQLQQAQKMEAIGQLAGGIAHDFNNILQVIIGYGEIMASELPADSPLVPMNRRILEATDKASTLTRSLLAFSRRQAMHLQPVDLNLLIERFSQFLGRVIGSAISLRFLPCAGPLVVHADSGQLEQTLLNLATNARDAMPDGGELCITTSRVCLSATDGDDAEPGTYARVQVRDTGQGIPSELQQRIFEPFFTTKDADRGTGLGLAMSFGIIQQHSGDLQVSSQPGQGSCFTIHLPLLEDSASASAAGQPPQPLTLQGNEHILLAEDRPDVARAVAANLQAHGYRLTVAGDGREALERFHAAPDSFDLLLLDVSMPYCSGPQVWQVARQLRPRLKTIFISGFPDDTLQQLPGEAGIILLQKPVDTSTLLRQIRTTLDS